MPRYYVQVRTTLEIVSQVEVRAKDGDHAEEKIQELLINDNKFEFSWDSTSLYKAVKQLNGSGLIEIDSEEEDCNSEVEGVEEIDE